MQSLPIPYFLPIMSPIPIYTTDNNEHRLRSAGEYLAIQHNRDLFDFNILTSIGS